MKDRMVSYRHAELIKAFFDSQRLLADVEEAPAGWHIYFDRELLICGEVSFGRPYTRLRIGKPVPKEY